MSITQALVLGHLGSTVVLLGVLWLVISVQSLHALATRLHRRWASIRRRAASTAPAPSTAGARSSGVDRRRPLHSSG